MAAQEPCSRLNRLSAKPRAQDPRGGNRPGQRRSQSPLGEAPRAGRRSPSSVSAASLNRLSAKPRAQGEVRVTRPISSCLNRLSAKPRAQDGPTLAGTAAACLNRLSAKPRAQVMQSVYDHCLKLSQSPLGEAPRAGWSLKPYLRIPRLNRLSAKPRAQEHRPPGGGGFAVSIASRRSPARRDWPVVRTPTSCLNRLSAKPRAQVRAAPCLARCASLNRLSAKPRAQVFPEKNEWRDPWSQSPLGEAPRAGRP